MKAPVASSFRSFRLPSILLLGCILLLAAGCATMSKPKIGIGGTDENFPGVGH